jgi:hypothetical protein
VLLRALGGGRTRSVPERALARDLFLRTLGLIYAIAFASLTVQIPVLVGSHGLLPAATFLERARPFVSFVRLPTLFWLDASDATLAGAGLTGVAAGLLLAGGVAPRICLGLVWALYLSFVSIGMSFLAFQWDNLLVESAFFALAVAPRALLPRRAPGPAPLGVLLVLWLAFRLHFESGIAKLASGDPSWRDLTAMASYYETAPIPTRLGWYVGQAPEWFHRLTSAVVLGFELGVPFLFWIPVRRLRAALFIIIVAFQAGIFLTANYGFFNPLSAALCILLLDDGHLAWVAARFGRTLVPRPPKRTRRWRTLALLGATAGLIPLTLVPFASVLHWHPVPSIEARLGPWRTIGAYHLFASMTLVRKEVVIEGSPDGETWEPYEFEYKPGAVDRAPPFVAPHQPRVDFLAWFLLLGGRDDEWFQALVKKIATEPDVVAPLFSSRPFDGARPRYLRVRTYRYRFADLETHSRTGAFWTREPLETSNVIDCSEYRSD